jgi:hypothetical protein
VRGSENRPDRANGNTVSRMDIHGSPRLFAEHPHSRGESTRMELKITLRAGEEALQRLIDASFRAYSRIRTATVITERRHVKSRRPINLCQDGGKRAR